jgi:hypothetical protein
MMLSRLDIKFVTCRFEVLQADMEGPYLHRPGNWLMRQLNDEPKWDLLERKESLQIEKCSGAQKPATHCSGEDWGFKDALTLG